MRQDQSLGPNSEAKLYELPIRYALLACLFPGHWGDTPGLCGMRARSAWLHAHTRCSLALLIHPCARAAG